MASFRPRFITFDCYGTLTKFRMGELAREIFFHDCSAAEISDALAQMRPQGGVPMRERTPLAAWPAVPAEYILCAEDRVVSPAWSRQVAAERLGVHPRELGGGH